MSKKKKSSNKVETIIKLLAATGTFLIGLANLIEALK